MLVWCEVVECYDNDRARLRKDFERVDALLDIARHPAHLGVIAARQPLFQPAPLGCKRLGADDSDFVESLEKSPCLDVARQDHYGSFWIVTLIIGSVPAGRLYETQQPAFGYLTSFDCEPSDLASTALPKTCCGVITSVAPVIKSTEIAVTWRVFAS